MPPTTPRYRVIAGITSWLTQSTSYLELQDGPGGNKVVKFFGDNWQLSGIYVWQNGRAIHTYLQHQRCQLYY